MGLLEAIPKFARLNKLVRANILTASSEEDDVVEEIRKQPTKEDIRSVKDANLITSETRPGYHIPVLDIDFDAAMVKSSTEGHFHLYLNREMPWETYLKLLEALTAAGIIQAGFLAGAKERRYSSVRLPHIDKNNPEDNVIDVEEYRKIKASGETKKAMGNMTDFANKFGGNWSPEKIEELLGSLELESAQGKLDTQIDPW